MPHSLTKPGAGNGGQGNPARTRKGDIESWQPYDGTAPRNTDRIRPDHRETPATATAKAKNIPPELRTRTNPGNPTRPSNGQTTPAAASVSPR